MNHSDHVSLIKNVITPGKQIWADFGSGEGAFTLALRDLLEEEGIIYSIDQDKSKLAIQKQYFERQFPNSQVHFINQNLMDQLTLPPLDGIIIANVLHFFPNPDLVLNHILGYVKEQGTLIVIEYNSDQSNSWVPYSLSFERLKKVLTKTQLTDVTFLDAVKSGFMNEIYSCFATKKPARSGFS